MKVKALIDCVGLGYEFEKGQTGELKEDLAEKLIKFRHVEEIKPPRNNKSRVKK